MSDQAGTTKRKRGERGPGRPGEVVVLNRLERLYRKILMGGGPLVKDASGNPVRDENGRLVRDLPSAAHMREARLWAEKQSALRAAGKLDARGNQRNGGLDVLEAARQRRLALIANREQLE